MYRPYRAENFCVAGNPGRCPRLKMSRPYSGSRPPLKNVLLFGNAPLQTHGSRLRIKRLEAASTLFSQAVAWEDQ